MMTQQDRRLGRQIKKHRKHLGWTQEYLAEQVRVSTKYIQFLEAGKERPSLRLLYRLARKFSIKVGDLFPHS